MTKARTTDSGSCEALLVHSDRIVKALSAGLITFDEGAYEITVMLVHAADHNAKLRDCWSMCLDVFPQTVLMALDQFLRTEVASVGYLYSSAAFLPDITDPQRVQAKKVELLPYFRELHEAVQSRL